MNNQRKKATRRSTRSTPGVRQSLRQPLFSYWSMRSWMPKPARKLIPARISAAIPNGPSLLPSKYKMPRHTRKSRQPMKAYKRYASPLKKSQWRSSPSSGRMLSSNSCSSGCEDFRNELLQIVPLRVVDFQIAEERGLRFDLALIADDDNLHVRRVEIF